MTRRSGVEECLDVECKKWLNPATLHKHFAIIKAKKLISKVVLLTDYINPNQATLLKEQNIPFIDLAGNTYINLPPVYIDIQGKKLEKSHTEMILKKQLDKAFQPKGMKVVLMLLIQADLVKEPLRTIADVSEVALGTVKQVIDDLIYQGLVVKNGQNTSLNVASKLPRGLVELYRLINAQSDALVISYLVIGATARNIILHHGFGAVIERGTRDVDFAIQVKSWQQFEQLKAKLFTNGFKAHEKKAHQLIISLTGDDEWESTFE